MPSHFKVKEYCPLVFKNLRERFNVDDVDYRESLTRSQPLIIEQTGKSGAQFSFSISSVSLSNLINYLSSNRKSFTWRHFSACFECTEMINAPEKVNKFK